jgi:hypothetical protein
MSPDAMWKMKLNETKTVEKIDITRVPGGWVYRFFANSPTAVFVPLDNEFVSSTKSTRQSN